MSIPYLENITRVVKKTFAGNGTPNPQRDWIFLISAGCIILLASALFSYVSTLTTDQTPPADSASAISETPASSIGSVQSIFATRTAEREKYERTLHFVDPSQ